MKKSGTGSRKPSPKARGSVRAYSNETVTDPIPTKRASWKLFHKIRFGGLCVRSCNPNANSFTPRPPLAHTLRAQPDAVSFATPRAKLQLLKDPFLCVPRRFPNATPQTRNTPNMQQGGGSLLPVLPSSMPATLSGINAQCFDMDKMLEYCGAPVRFNRQLRRK